MHHILHIKSLFQSVIFIPDRTFLVPFGDTSGEFGRAMVRILARPNEPDMPPKRNKKVQLGILSYPNFQQN